MADKLLLSLLISLLLTLMLETLFALCFRVKGKALVLVELVNLFTNPIVVLLCVTFPQTWLLVTMEVFAVTAEWLLYRFSGLIKRPLLFSLGANIFSYFAGELLQMLTNLL